MKGIIHYNLTKLKKQKITMKKLLLIAVLMLTIKASFGQDYISHRNQVGQWDSYSKKWVWSEVKKATIPVYFEDGKVRLDNKNQSVYTLYSSEDEVTSYTDDSPKVKIVSKSWLGYDKNDKRCRITLAFFHSDKYDPLTVTVQYDDICLRFYCNKKTLDSYLED